LYEKNDINLTGNYDYSIGGNMIGVRTLDLNQDFKIIKSQMDKIIDNFSL